MKINIIISTYNSPEWLEKVLWGFENQDDNDFEILIADDGSSRENQKRIKQFISSTTLAITHVWQKDDGFRKCRILNEAIAKSTGDYLIFTDGDCIPFPGFILAHRKMSKPGMYLSGGYSKLPMKQSQQITRQDITTARCFDPTWLGKHGLPLSKTWLKIGAARWGLDGILNKLTPAKRTFNGNNSSCFKKDALAVNGFDERMHYGGEDREFGYRLENIGVKPLGIRYSAMCLHLDHPRGYVDQELRAKNNEIINMTKSTQSKRATFGVDSHLR